MNQHSFQPARKRVYLAPASEEISLTMHGILCISGRGTESFGTVTNRYGEDDFDE